MDLILFPIVLVTKPRMLGICLDCRKVNSFTEKDAYPLPQTSSRLPKAKSISSIDLKDDCWQLPLHVKSRVNETSEVFRLLGLIGNG